MKQLKDKEYEEFQQYLQWTFRKNTGAVHFTEEQMEWLCLIKDHIITSLSILPEDLNLTPFDRCGGLVN